MAGDDKTPAGVRQTVNGRLLDQAIRRQVYLLRFGSGAVKDTLRFLDERLFDELIAILSARLSRIEQRGVDLGPVTTDRIRQMVQETAALLRVRMNDAGRRVRQVAGDLAGIEAEAAVKAMQRLSPTGLDLQFRTLQLSQLQTILDTGINGTPLDSWFDKLGQDTVARIEQQIGIGIATGETNEQVIRRIRGTRAGGYMDGVLGGTRRQAQTVVRTTMNHVSTQTRQRTYAANPDLVKGVQWVSTLDTRTSDVCKARDGKVYPLDKGPRPPAHPNCRSTVTPVLKSWRELGFKAKDVPAATRASMDGQVPASVSYGDWLNDQTPDRQDEALGRRRAELFRAGKISVEDLVRQDGKPLTLEQLRDLE